MAHDTRPMSSGDAECSGCGAFAQVKRCGRCRSACYCSVECQRKHWKQHKPVCVPSDAAPIAQVPRAGEETEASSSSRPPSGSPSDSVATASPAAHPIEHKTQLRAGRLGYWFLARDEFTQTEPCPHAVWDLGRDLVRLCSRPLCPSVDSQLADDAPSPPEWTCRACLGRHYCSEACRDMHAPAHAAECKRISAIDVTTTRGSEPAWWTAVGDGYGNEDLVALVSCLARGGQLVHEGRTFWSAWCSCGSGVHNFGDRVAFAHLRVLLATVAQRTRPSIRTIIDVADRMVSSDWGDLVDRLSSSLAGCLEAILSDLIRCADADKRPEATLKYVGTSAAAFAAIRSLLLRASLESTIRQTALLPQFEAVYHRRRVAFDGRMEAELRRHLQPISPTLAAPPAPPTPPAPPAGSDVPGHLERFPGGTQGAAGTTRGSARNSVGRRSARSMLHDPDHIARGIGARYVWRAKS